MKSLSLLLLILLQDPAPDGSLSVKDLMEKGLPAPDRMWSAPDMAKALEVLREVGKGNPDRLPRLASAVSGPVFRRVVSEENIEPYLSDKAPLEVRVPHLAQWLGHYGTLSTLYLPALLKGRSADAEVVQILCLILQVMPPLMEGAEQLIAKIAPEDPSRKARLDGLEKMKKGMATSVTGYFMTLSDRETLPAVHRLTLIKALCVSLPKMVRFLGEHSRAELPARCDLLVEGETDEAVVKALEDLRKAVVDAPK